jgi:acyl-coenzyme A synthetase/AMP-(fatty) acid ligase/thioesterase domain-containing protein
MELNSDQVALSYGAKEITYEELLRLCSEVKTDSSAIVFVETSDPLERVVSVVAAVLSGRAIALIDPALPDFRRDGMRKLLAQLPPEPELAYVQFTSGSTGVPKAAMLHRAGLANLARTVCRDLSISQGSRVLQLAAPAFDAWIWEVFTTLAGGGTLVLVERVALQPGSPLAVTLASNRITHVTITPSALAAIGAVKLPDLRVVVVAGEALSSELVQMWAPGRRLFNAYGPCEATVCATYGLCQPNETAPHIGTPIAGVSIRIFDRNGELVLPGVTGELCIAGLGVGLGYVADEANTQTKFFVDPNSGERCYRSGDKARIRSDGCIQFIGRDDRQVKVRGVRIELDEVELTLRDSKGVVEAAVKAVSTHDGLPSVAAWVKLESGFAVSDVRNSLANRLPETMLPSFMVHVSDLPMTATGKIDRNRLELPLGDLLLEGDQPEPGCETQLAEVFRCLLHLERLPGRHQNFFTLGGHSILAVRLADEIKKLFGRQVPLGLIFANPTPAGIAQLVSKGGEEKVLLRVLRDGVGPTAYFVHSVDGTCKAYELLAASWPTDRRIVAVEQGDELVTLSEQVIAYAEAIEVSSANSDPVLIAGWSLGAAIAAEITRVLRRSGRDVRVVLVDAAVPSHIDDNGAIRRDLADIEKIVGIDSITLRRVEQNVLQAGSHVFAPAGGSAVLFRAEMTCRDGLDETLGWASIFSRVSVKSIPGASHQTIIREGNLAHLGSRIENAWMEQTE